MVALAKFLSIDETELLTVWLADKVLEKKTGLRPLFAVINEQRSCDLFVTIQIMFEVRGVALISIFFIIYTICD